MPKNIGNPDFVSVMDMINEFDDIETLSNIKVYIESRLHCSIPQRGLAMEEVSAKIELLRGLNNGVDDHVFIEPDHQMQSSVSEHDSYEKAELMVIHMLCSKFHSAKDVSDKDGVYLFNLIKEAKEDLKEYNESKNNRI